MGEMNAPRRPEKPSMWRLLLLLVLWTMFFVALIESTTVVVAWWQGGFRALGTLESVWVVSFPALLFVYIRYFSILRPACTACATPDEKDAQQPPR